MKKILFIPLILLFACDRIKEDVLPEVSVQPVVYTESGGQAVISLYGGFDREGLEITSNSNQIRQIGDLPYLIFDTEDLTIENQMIDLEILEGRKVIGNASLEIRSVNSNDCINSGFSDHYVVQAGDSLGVNLLENDAFCDFVDPGTRGVKEVPIANFDNVLLSVAPNEATLSYRSPPGFTGTVEFIYEICFGFNAGFDEDIFENPILDCKYYYTALVTIEVL